MHKEKISSNHFMLYISRGTIKLTIQKISIELHKRKPSVPSKLSIAMRDQDKNVLDD